MEVLKFWLRDASLHEKAMISSQSMGNWRREPPCENSFNALVKGPANTSLYNLFDKTPFHIR